MKETLNNVDDLYEKTERLLTSFDLIKDDNKKLLEDLKLLKTTLSSKEKEIIELKKKYNSLKIAGSIIDNGEKVLTKKKIKKMIDDIDDCILNLMG